VVEVVRRKQVKISSKILDKINKMKMECLKNTVNTFARLNLILIIPAPIKPK
jgi:hypothetical protein